MSELHATTAPESAAGASESRPEPRPAHMLGHLAPVTDEITTVDLPVTGALPPELTGRYLRNGPNPMPGGRLGALVRGDGMLHGVRLRDGRAEWYRNRWVRTRRLAGARSSGRRRHPRPRRDAGQHPRHRARRAAPRPGRGGLPYESPRAGHGRPVRLRRQADHRDDRAPQVRPGHRRAALLRLRRAARRT